MIKGKGNINYILGAAGVLLLLAAALIKAVPEGGLLPGSGKTITVGVFSDSYWEVPNGYA